MVFQLPMHLIICNVIPFLNPKDTYNLVLANKLLYQEFCKVQPHFRKYFGPKHTIACCLHDMINFVRTGNNEVASWGFYTKKNCFVIVRTGRTCYFCIDGINRDIVANNALELFKSLILSKWNNVEMSTRCNYKNIKKRKEYRDITSQMLCCISSSL